MSKLHYEQVNLSQPFRCGVTKWTSYVQELQWQKFKVKKLKYHFNNYLIMWPLWRIYQKNRIVRTKLDVYLFFTSKQLTKNFLREKVLVSKTKALKSKIECLGTREKYKKSEVETTSFIFLLDTLRCLKTSGGTIFNPPSTSIVLNIFSLLKHHVHGNTKL